MDDKLLAKLLPPGHKKPLTRRDFIGLGLVQAPSFIMMPSLVDLLLNEKVAQGADLCSAISGGIPFITFDFAGGDISPQTWTALTTGGDPLNNNDTFALGTAPSPLDRTFGAPMNMPNGTNNAPMYTAFINALNTQVNGAGMSAADKNNIVMSVIACILSDDTSNNILNADGLIASAGLNGQLFQALGRGNSRSATSVATVPVANVQDVLNAVNLGPLSALTSGQKSKLMQTASNLNEGQLAKLNKMSFWDQLSALLGCATTKTTSLLLNPATGVDPRTVPEVQQIYGINAASNNEDARQAAIVYNALTGNSGPATVTIGGFDAHGQGQAAQDTIAATGGRAIGRAIRLASALGKKFMFAKISDGSGASPAGNPAWNADSGPRSMVVMGTYDPARRASLKTPQIGGFSQGQVVDPSTFFANPTNANLIPYAILANWLSLSGGDALAKKFPNNIFPTQQILDSIVTFG